jgi:hypothetical protein
MLEGFGRRIQGHKPWKCFGVKTLLPGSFRKNRVIMFTISYMPRYSGRYLAVSQLAQKYLKTMDEHLNSQIYRANLRRRIDNCKRQKHPWLARIASLRFADGRQKGGHVEATSITVFKHEQK